MMMVRNAATTLELLVPMANEGEASIYLVSRGAIPIQEGRRFQVLGIDQFPGEVVLTLAYPNPRGEIIERFPTMEALRAVWWEVMIRPLPERQACACHSASSSCL